MKRGWIIKYTFGYFILAAIICACYFVNGKSFAVDPDGFSQGYVAFEFVSQALRAPFTGAEISMIDFGLGQGFDSLAALSYYGVTDPLNAIAVFASGDWLEYLFALTTLIRIYLSGLFFAWFCRAAGIKADRAIACAALMYAFSGFMQIAAFRHAHFGNGPMYLPLMLLGAEWALKNRRTYPLAIFSALMLITNFYFAYINTLLVVIYIVLRLIAITRADGVKPGAKAGLRALGGYLLGLGLAAVVFAPVAYAFLGNSRLAAGIINTDSLIYYDSEYYALTAATFGIPYATGGNWVCLNFAPPAVMCALALMFTRKPDTTAKTARGALIITLLCLLVPLAGKIFNGFGYVTNRWCYGVAMAMCFATAKVLPDIHLISGWRRVAIFAITGIYLACSAVIIMLPIRNPTWLVLREDRLKWALTLLPLAGYALMLFFASRRGGRANMPHYAATLISLAVFTAFTFGALKNSYTQIFVDDDLIAQLEKETGAAAREIDDPGFYRVAQRMSDDSHARLNGYKGVGYFLSVVPENCLSHINALGVSRTSGAARLFGLGNGAALNELAAVKYYLYEQGQGDYAPYGFDFVKTVEQSDGDLIDIYENTLALPVGYVYYDYMTENDYRALNPVEKRAALMRAAVVDSPIAGVDEIEFAKSAREIEYEVVSVENIEPRADGMSVKSGGAINIEFDAPQDCEIYLVFDNMRMADSAASRMLGEVYYGERETEFIFTSIYNVFGYDQTGAAICLGVGGAGELRLEFTPDTGRANVNFSGIRLYAAPIAEYESAASELRDSGMKNVVQTKNGVAGDVTLERAGVLQIAVPYAKGWKAYVDGAEAEILPCGGMYMGVMLDSGEHHVEISYATPYLSVGAAISLISLCAGLALLLIARRRRGVAQRSDG